MPLYLNKWSSLGPLLQILFNTEVCVSVPKAQRRERRKRERKKKKSGALLPFSYYSCTLRKHSSVWLNSSNTFYVQKMKDVTHGMLQLALCMPIINFIWISTYMKEDKILFDEKKASMKTKFILFNIPFHTHRQGRWIFININSSNSNHNSF